MSLFRSRKNAIDLANRLAQTKYNSYYVYRIGKKFEIVDYYRGSVGLEWTACP